jgi:hypothetical protein
VLVLPLFSSRVSLFDYSAPYSKAGKKTPLGCDHVELDGRVFTGWYVSSCATVSFMISYYYAKI